MIGISTTSNGAGWTIIAAWTPSNAPRSSSSIFPPPPSSAGVPRTDTVRPASSATGSSAMPAPADMAAMTLWPHAWPISGSASYSQQMAMCSGPSPARAANAVGRSWMPVRTSNPAPASISATAAADPCSS